MTRKLLLTAAIVTLALTPSIGTGTAQARGFGGGGLGGGFHGGLEGGFHGGRFGRGFYGVVAGAGALLPYSPLGSTLGIRKNAVKSERMSQFRTHPNREFFAALQGI